MKHHPDDSNNFGAPGAASRPPLIVDLDGTLTPTDTLIESVIQLVKQSPLNFLRLPLWIFRGRATLKHEVASRTSISAENLPYHEPFLAYLRSERNDGRRIILATAAHRAIAENVSAHLGLFDQVLATDENHNLKGAAKLHAIQEAIGADFVYAGDSRADIPIWEAARAGVLVGVSPGIAASIRQKIPIEQEFSKEKIGLSLWLKAFRAHQWLKNLLLFVPLFTAFSFFDGGKLSAILIAFIAFSLAASATYIINDLLDLESDRAHPRKKNRPFAAARIPILKGLGVAISALGVSLALAFAVSTGFLLVLLLYIALSSAYSWLLKEYVLLDVIVLSVLYTLRIFAGSVAVEIPISSWLLAFSVFVFLSLALVKRCSDLVTLDQIGRDRTRGRDYRVTDLVVLWPLGVGASLSAVVVFGLFITSPETLVRYNTPTLLWLVGIGLIYWLGRLWIKTSRGEMDDDPMIYAVANRGSRITIAVMAVTMLAAHYLTLGAF